MIEGGPSMFLLPVARSVLPGDLVGEHVFDGGGYWCNIAEVKGR